MTKKSLRKSLGKIHVTFNELRTLIVETEAVLNSRPLTYLGDDIESGCAITPGHFLSINIRCGIPEINSFIVGQDSAKQVLQQWKKGQAYLNQLWNIWIKEYLPAIRERQVNQMKSVKGEVRRKPTIGDVVVVKDEGLPRGKWKLARIIGLIKGEVDGIERAANLKLSSGRTAKGP